MSIYRLYITYIWIQLCILLLPLRIFVYTQGRNYYYYSFLTIFLLNQSCIILIVPTTGCDVISSEGTCYSNFTSTGINWVDARLQCVSRGSDLATITSLEENTLMFSLIVG